MKIKILLFVFSLCLSLKVFSQEPFAGFKTGNYIGVAGVIFNPANVADNRYRWDVNLLSVGAGLQNDAVDFNLNTIGKLNHIDSLLGNATSPVNALANVSVLAPSFMFHINHKTSFAFTSQARVMINISDFDGRFFKSIENNGDNSTSYPYTLSSNQNQSLTINAWKEFGFTLGRILIDNKKNFLKAGITLKYVSGVANAYLNIDHINGIMNKDANDEVYLQNASGGLSIGEGGVNIDNFDASKLVKFKGAGFGGDIGIIYEYRPDSNYYDDRGHNKYKFKVGISLIDIGQVNYTPDTTYTAGYNVHVGSAQKFYFSDLDGKSLSEIKTYLDGSPYFTNTGSSTANYSVPLPTTLQVDVDYNIHKGFYANLSGMFSLINKGNYKNAFNTNSFTFTPRIESKGFGFYLPINYNSISHFNIGAAFKLGPLYFGSESIITSAFGNSRQADVFIGIHFGGFRKGFQQ